MKLIALQVLVLGVTAIACAQTAAPDANANVRHIIGLNAIKRNATGKLTVQDGTLEFKTGHAADKVPVASIDDIFTGAEVTQSGGKAGEAIKAAAIAAPYGSGSALPLLMRTKVDILTVSFHDPGGALHGAIFALPVGRAEQMRTQLIEAGAHASAARAGKP